MLAGGVGVFAGDALKKSAGVVIKASETAELGAVKPKGFGLLIRQRFPVEAAKRQIDGIYSMEFPQINIRGNLLGPDKAAEGRYPTLRYNETAKECSEYLCDYGITPWTWQEANPEQRMNMLKTAAQIMAKELRLPPEWVHNLNPAAVSGKDYAAAASCRIGILDNGGVEILDTPALRVNADCLTDDYLEAMSAVYREMIHMKQYASVDGVIPGLTTDSRLLDLMNEMRASGGDYSSAASFLSSPHEAEAWAQSSYFKKTLQSIVKERY